MVLGIVCIFILIGVVVIVMLEMWFNDQAKTIRKLEAQLKHTEELVKHQDKEFSKYKESYYQLYKELEAYRTIDDWDKRKQVEQQYNLEKDSNYNGSQE
jgi:cell shape-determining protein MreC